MADYELEKLINIPKLSLFSVPCANKNIKFSTCRNTLTNVM